MSIAKVLWKPLYAASTSRLAAAARTAKFEPAEGTLEADRPSSSSPAPSPSSAPPSPSRVFFSLMQQEPRLQPQQQHEMRPQDPMFAPEAATTALSMAGQPPYGDAALASRQERESSVVVVLFEKPVDASVPASCRIADSAFYQPGAPSPHLLLIKRSPHGIHGGQIAFPGGVRDRGESLQEAACREVFEEVGIQLNPLQIVSELPWFRARVSNTRVKPFVAALEQYYGGISGLSISKLEVEQVLEVPLGALLQTRCFDPAASVLADRKRDIRWVGPVFSLDASFTATKIWGLTSRILVSVLDGISRELVLGSSPRSSGSSAAVR